MSSETSQPAASASTAAAAAKNKPAGAVRKRSSRLTESGISSLDAIACVAAMLGVHLVLLWFSSWHHSIPFNDVTGVYRGWLDQAQASGEIPGIDAPLVYPVLSIIPMWLADLLGGHAHYAAGWVAIVFLLACIPLYLLIGRNRDAFNARLRLRAAWYWVLFMALLGVISIGRIDAVTVPIVIAALLISRRRIAASGALLTIGAWIKVWPAAVFAALVTVHRKRWHAIAAGAAVSMLIVLVGVLIGGVGAVENLKSFVSGQNGRGLQVESVGASPFLILAAIEVPGYLIFFNHEIITVEITGPGTDMMATVLTPLMFVMVAALIGYAWWCMRAGTSVARALPALTLGLVTTFIIANKVGSPQFYAWLAAPIMLGLVWDGRRYRNPAIIALVVALLTQLIYPFNYGHLMRAADLAVATIVLRNVLLIVLLVYAVVLLRPRRREFVPIKQAFASATKTTGAEPQRGE